MPRTRVEPAPCLRPDSPSPHARAEPLAKSVMTPIAQREDPDSSRAGLARAAAVLVLLLVAVLVPTLGPSAALDGTGEGTAPGSGAVTLLRTVMFAGLSLHVGELFVRLLTRRVPGVPGPNAPESPKSWAVAASAVGFLSALGLALIVANGNVVPSQLSEMDLGGLQDTRDGFLALVEVNGFMLAALCAMSRLPSLATLPLGAVIVAESLRAHPEVYSPLFGSALTLAHLTCAALWTGGLIHVLRSLHSWREAAPAARPVLLGLYARIALLLFAVLTVTGILSTLRRLPLEGILTTAYGRVLVAKLILVVAVAVLALLARSRMRGASDPGAALVPARAEVVVLLVVIAVSALLTAVPIPVFYQPAFWWTWF